jgi:TonB family protein
MRILKANHLTLCIIIFVFGLTQPQTDHKSFGFYHESYAREIAITRSMPIYPSDAVRRGITGVVQVKIEIDERGEVAMIKLHPKIDPSLKQSVADAVDKWTFRLEPETIIAGRNSLSHLTFKFSINSGEPLVELYDPGPNAKDSERLGYLNTSKELREWNTWEEVQPSQMKTKLKQ